MKPLIYAFQLSPNQKTIIIFRSIFLWLFTCSSVYGQVTLEADGPGNTYELINTRFGGGAAGEVPDCSHTSFGRHITEAFDSELNKNVFVFHIHASIDNDRCTNFDRQRNEIKGNNTDTRVTQNQTAYMRWKFKLDAGFKPSSRFTHIMQIKAQDGDAGAPLMTLTPRAGTPERMQVIHSAGEGTGSLGTIAQVDLAPFKGHWVEAYMEFTSSEGSGGTFSLVIRRISDGAELLSVSRTGIDMWRTGASVNRPKWGIYRGLDPVLRDEQVRFADFCISKTSAGQCPSSIGTLPSITTGTTQAESLNLSAFQVETGFNGATVAKPTSTTTGFINGRFTGATGNYNVTVRYYDEDDGAATITLKTNGATRGTRIFSANDNAWHTWTANNIPISNGHEIRIEGARQSGEHCRLDYIQISAASTLPSIGTGTTQAESLNLSGFQIETDFNGATVAKPTSTTLGYINGTFTGSSGNYNVTIRYYDEDDGAATITLKTNGVTRGTRTLSANNNAWHTWTVNNISISNGHEIRIEGARQSGEHCRLDYLQVASATGSATARSASSESDSPGEDIISDEQSDAALICFPNPTSGKVTVRYTVAQPGRVRLSLYTMDRESAVLLDEQQSAGVHEHTFATDGLSKGMHIIKLYVNNKLDVQKLIKN